MPQRTFRLDTSPLSSFPFSAEGKSRTAITVHSEKRILDCDLLETVLTCWDTWRSDPNFRDLYADLIRPVASRARGGVRNNPATKKESKTLECLFMQNTRIDIIDAPFSELTQGWAYRNQDNADKIFLNLQVSRFGVMIIPCMTVTDTL
jgi:hypothetical protein